MTPLSRRTLLLAAAALPLIATEAAGQQIDTRSNERRFAGASWRRLTDAQWQARLPDLPYRVLRHEYTERAGTSPLDAEERRGTFVCAGCGLALFNSTAKFHSGTGWPSFFRAIDVNIGTKVDTQLSMRRTEYHCEQCLGHQGHLFNDGPRPTGLRYCNNGAALRFVPT